jgi:hypothetical protein
MNPNRKPTRGPKKPLRVPAPKPVIEYSERGRRVLTADEAAALVSPTEKTAADKAAKSGKRTFSDETADGEGSKK